MDKADQLAALKPQTQQDNAVAGVGGCVLISAITAGGSAWFFWGTKAASYSALAAFTFTAAFLSC